MVERTKVKRKPDLILCSDMHLREDTPTCFTGDFQKEQWIAMDFISDLQEKYDCAVIHAGDLFHHWKPSPWLLSITIQHLPKEFYTIYGQHDLPQHNWELRDKSGIYTLEKAGALEVLSFTHYGQLPDKKLEMIYTDWFRNKILVWHYLTYIEKPFPGAKDGNAMSILKKYPNFDLIVTGDNHQSFTVEYQGRRLVNPGSMTRQSADQIDFKPCIYLWYAEDNSVQQVFLPIQEGAVTREHIEHKEERDGRIDAFISKMVDDWQVKLSFEDNLKEYFAVNDTDEEIKEIIYKSIGK